MCNMGHPICLFVNISSSQILTNAHVRQTYIMMVHIYPMFNDAGHVAASRGLRPGQHSGPQLRRGDRHPLHYRIPGREVNTCNCRKI